MDGQGLRMCRFTRDGIPELGEYLESVDGTGICKLTELDGGGEEVVVCLPDGTQFHGWLRMVHGILGNDCVELVRVDFHVCYGPFRESIKIAPSNITVFEAQGRCGPLS